MKKVRQKDIAECLNLSRVTVTKALKDHQDIAMETRKKVKEKALEMGYILDHIGQSLSSRRTYTLGIVIPKIDHSFFSYSIEKIYEAAQKRGYNIIPMISFEDCKQEIENIRKLLSLRVDGIILDIAQNCTDNAGYELAIKSGCSVVFYDRCLTNHTNGSIVTDDRKGAYRLTRHLIEKGYRKIFHFAGPSSLNISYERQRGYEDAMTENNLTCSILNVKLKKESGYEAFLRLAREKELPDAIFAVNDSVAHGIYDAIAELGLKIPGNIAVAGFGDVRTSSLISPSMTTIRPPLDKMVEAAVEMLVKMIEKNSEPFNQKIFESELIIRDST